MLCLGFFLIVTLIASGVLFFYFLASFMFYRLLSFGHIHLFTSICLYYCLVLIFFLYLTSSLFSTFHLPP